MSFKSLVSSVLVPLLLFALTTATAPWWLTWIRSTFSGEKVPQLAGTWLCHCACPGGRGPFKASQDGKKVTFTDPKGKQSAAYITSNEALTVPGWTEWGPLGLDAKISEDGKKITWVNGSVWTSL